MIKQYSFGTINVNGQDYDHDIELHWDGRVEKWWRQNGHFFRLDDTRRALERGPELIVMGIGESGMARVTEALKEHLREQDIEYIIEKTALAVEIFNQAARDGKQVIGLFHLTC